MNIPIARRVENSFLDGLRQQLSALGYGQSRLPGVAAKARSGVTAPYYVVQCKEAQNTTSRSGVFKVEIRVVLVSSLDDSTSAEHDDRLAAIERALDLMPRNAIDTEQGVRFYGFFLESQDTATEDQSFGDVLIIPAGVGQIAA